MRDWTEIETMYIAGDMSQRDLAKSLGISYSTLTKVATEKKWSDKRKKHRAKVAKAALRRAGARSQRKLERLISATEQTIDVALSALEDKDQFRRYIVTEGSGEGVSETSEKVFNKVDAKALKDITSALRDLTALARDFYGIPTPAQSVSEKIAMERHELEMRKIEADLADREKDSGERKIRVELAEAEALSE